MFHLRSERSACVEGEDEFIQDPQSSFWDQCVHIMSLIISWLCVLTLSQAHFVIAID